VLAETAPVPFANATARTVIGDGQDWYVGGDATDGKGVTTAWTAKLDIPADGLVTECSMVAGRARIGVDPDTGGQICRVRQATAGDAAGVGWSYVETTPELGLLSSTPGTAAPPDAIAHFRCFAPSEGGDAACAR
jgi:hypothetical protein